MEVCLFQENKRYNGWMIHLGLIYKLIHLPYNKTDHQHCSLCGFSMMVKWAYDGWLPDNASKMLVNDGQMRAFYTNISLKLTIIASFDHHWEAASTALITGRPTHSFLLNYQNLCILSSLRMLLFSHSIQAIYNVHIAYIVRYIAKTSA